jgi:hypothetical protein
MSATRKPDPKYRHYLPKNLGVVRIDGKDHYLGKFGSPESFQKYHQLLAARYTPSPPRSASDQPKPATETLTIDELCLRYYLHAQKYYQKNGRPTSQVLLIRLSLKVLRRLYGSALAKDFGPLSLELCQAEFIRDGLCRNEVNRRVRLIRAAFRWGVSKQLVTTEVWQALTAVPGLKDGRTEARESVPVGPVPDRIVEQTLNHLCPTLAAMVQVQRLSAMRPGEVVIMRARDLDMSREPWTYRPPSHKGQHHAKDCEIPIGPRGREIIRKFLTLDVGCYLFSAKRAVDEQNALHREARETPRYDSHVRHQANRRKARGRRPLGDHYTVNGYRLAVSRACDQAFPHPDTPERLDGESARDFRQRAKTWRESNAEELKAWRKNHRWHPHQLRHAQATAIRKEHGAEASQVVLRHAQLYTTEIYAQRDSELARKIIEEIG